MQTKIFIWFYWLKVFVMESVWTIDGVVHSGLSKGLHSSGQKRICKLRSYHWRAAMSSWRSQQSSVIFTELNNTPSSTNSLVEELCVARRIHSDNGRGPRTVPCVTPKETGNVRWETDKNTLNPLSEKCGDPNRSCIISTADSFPPPCRPHKQYFIIPCTSFASVI